MFFLLSWDCLVEMHARREIQFTFLGGKLNSLCGGKASCQALVTRSIILCWDLVLNSVSKVLTILLCRVIFSNRFIFGFGSD